MDQIKMKINTHIENLEKIDKNDKNDLEKASTIILNFEHIEEDLNKEIKLCEKDIILKEKALKKAKKM